MTDATDTVIEAVLTAVSPLAASLEKIASGGRNAFYGDKIARSIGAFMRDVGPRYDPEITDEAHALTTALKGQSQARGAWGELILDRLLESAGLIRGQDYLTQESLTTDDGRRLRPDVILRLPDARHLVIETTLL